MPQVYGSLYFIDETRSEGLNRPEMPITVQALRMCSFRIKATMRLSSCSFVDTACTNLACDSLGMRDNGISKSQCPCWKVEHRVGGVVACAALKVDCQGICNPGHSFMVKNFTSRQFTANFIEGETPPGLSAAMILDNRVLRTAMRRNVSKYINIVNLNGQWNLEGWIKPGLQMDRGTVDNSSAGNARNIPSQHSMIASSNLIYHITSARPADSNMEGAVRHQLEALKMNLTSFPNLPADGAAGNVNLGANVDGA